jgi:hypothetical protein
LVDVVHEAEEVGFAGGFEFVPDVFAEWRWGDG